MNSKPQYYNDYKHGHNEGESANSTAIHNGNYAISYSTKSNCGHNGSKMEMHAAVTLRKVGNCFGLKATK